MKHKVKLEWNAFMLRLSGQKRIETFNIIDDGMIEDIEKAHKRKELNTWQDLYNVIDKYLRWRYWGRFEYEFVISDLFGRDEYKEDVYWQLKMNMDKLVDYINTKMQIGLK